MTLINEFPWSVIEKLGYYVYVLIDPRNNQIFYVGKGTGNRIFAHINAAVANATANDKLDTIRAIHAQGLEVQHIIQRHGLIEKEALEIEAALIDFIGLVDLTNQVQGHNSDDRGQMAITEVIAKYQAPIIEIIEPAILITVNRLYRRGMSAEELYEITRGNWVIGSRREAAKYAFAIYKGIVREVYTVVRWFPVTARNATQKIQQRWRFEGAVESSMQHYLGGNIEKYSVLGAQNPIRYINC